MFDDYRVSAKFRDIYCAALEVAGFPVAGVVLVSAINLAPQQRIPTLFIIYKVQTLSLKGQQHVRYITAD